MMIPESRISRVSIKIEQIKEGALENAHFDFITACDATINKKSLSAQTTLTFIKKQPNKFF